MSTMLYALGRRMIRARWYVVIGWVLLFALLGGGAALLGKGTTNSFDIPGTESQQALDRLAATFPQVSGASAQLVVVSAPGTKITDPDYRSAIGSAVTALKHQSGVATVASPYAKGSGAVAKDGRAAILNIQLRQQQTDVSTATEDGLTRAVHRVVKTLPAGTRSELGGSLYSGSVPGVSATDAIGLIVAIVVLIITLGSVLAAGMPLISAILGVGVSVTGILAATVFGPVSGTTPLLAVMLGLAVGIDYALFLVARHLDQLRHGMDPAESIARAVATAGSAVIFAGTTVVIALLGLSVANIPFLTTMGVASAVAVAVAVLAALTFVPALLSFAGLRLLGSKRARARRQATVDRRAAAAVARGVAPAPTGPRPNRFFLGWLRAATRWPIVTILAVVAVLGLAILPATKLHLDLTNAQELPTSDPAHRAYDLVSEHFGPGYNGPLLLEGSIVASDDPVGLMKKVAAEIRTLPDVAAVPLATPNAAADTGIVQVVPKSGPNSPRTAALVNRLRDLRGHFQDEYGVTFSVTGFTALGIDISHRLGGALLPFGALVVGLSLILLAMVFRSIAVPIKATLGYLLSVLASLGVVSGVYELGWFAGPLGIPQTGPVISFMPIIVMGVLFGLAMDYEVFLVSRMREEYVHHGDAKAAIEHGFLGSAKVVTAAAIIMFSVFAAFVPSGDSTIKPMAIGLASGVFADAFLVRMTLVPAVMALLGRRAWWLPRGLDRVLPRFDVEGEGLERDLSLADWPEPGNTDAVVADGLSCEARGRLVLPPTALRVAPGEIAVVPVADAAAGRALALAVTGRARPTGGTLKALGHVVPEHSGAVRRSASYLDVSDGVDLGARLDAALRGPVELVAVDGLDHLTDPLRLAALRSALEGAMTASAAAGRPITVLAPSTEPDRARRLLPAAPASRTDHTQFLEASA